MIGFLILIFILSVGFQCFWSIRETRDWANPVVFFSAIHCVHNWIRSFFYCFDDFYAYGGVLISINDEQGAENLLRNLVGQWVFFLISWGYRNLKKRRVENSSGWWELIPGQSLVFVILPYGILTILSVGLSFVFGGPGGEQALTGTTAFAGFWGLLGVRPFFWIYALVNSGLRKYFKVLLFTFPVELILAGGARKLLLMGLLSWLFAYFYVQIKSLGRQGVISFVKRGAMMLIPAYVVLFFMAARREARGEGISIVHALGVEFERVFSNPLLIFKPLCATNSESLHIWCAELIEKGSLNLMYGKSYIQAILNVVVLRPFQGEIANWQGAYAFKMVAYPNISNHGWDFSFSAEALLNWGCYGFFISFALFSWVFSWLYLRRDRSLFWQNFYFLFVAVCFVSFRTDATALLRFLSCFLLVCLYARIFGKDKSFYHVPRRRYGSSKE